MGNCQANDAAAAVVQHPDGSIVRLYWPTSADEVMRSYPGHYVAQVTLCISKDGRRAASNPAVAADRDTVGTVRFTRVRLLRHRDTLLIGHVYRLITSQEVTEALKARKSERIRKAQAEVVKRKKSASGEEGGVDSGERNAQIDSQIIDQEIRYERQRQRSSRCWQPSLQSISELGS